MQRRSGTQSSGRGLSHARAADAIMPRWTAEEHGLFQMGCAVLGWGKWKAIAEMIPTRTGKQVRDGDTKAKRPFWGRNAPPHVTTRRVFFAPRR